jgi:hypothetical protein
MTVSVTSGLGIVTEADGITKVFNYNRRLTSAADLVVMLYIDGSYTIQNIGTHYTLSAPPYTNGATVTFVTAPVQPDKVVMVRSTEVKQIVDLENLQNNDANSVEAQLDRLAMGLQDAKNDLALSPKFAYGSPNTGMLVPEPDNGKVLGWVDGKLRNVDELDPGNYIVGSAGAILLSADTMNEALGDLGGGSYGIPIFKAATRAAIGLIAGLVSTGNGVADDAPNFTAAMTAGGLHFIQRPLSAYNFAAPLTTNGAAWLPDPTMTWAQLTDTGQFNMHRGHVTSGPNGANIWRFSDRVFIGEAANKWAASALGVTDTGTSWMGDNANGPAYLGVGAALIVTTEENLESGLRIGGTFGAYANDNTGNAMALSAYVRNRRTSPAGASWALYLEADHEAGAASFTYAAEIEVRNSSGVNNNPTPYAFTPPGSLGLWIVASGHTLYGPASTGPNMAAVVIGRQGTSTWYNGLMFTFSGIEGTDGSAGTTTYGKAIVFARHHKVSWASPDTGGEGASITSGVNVAASRTAMEFRNNAIRLEGANGSPMLLLAHTANADNYIQINNTISGSDPKLQATGLTDVDVDLWMSGKGAGVLRFGNWTSNADAPVNGYVTIKDDGGVVRKLATIA